MADDLLFSTLDVSPEVSSKSDLSSNSKTGDSSQPSDFKRIFSEQVSLRDTIAKNSRPKQSEENDSSPAGLTDNEELATAENGSLEEGIEGDIGKTLPSLTVHDRALEIGRVILTTARPMVNDSSLSEFVRRQGQPDKAIEMEMAQTAKHPESNTTSKQSEIGVPGQFNGLTLEVKFNPESKGTSPASQDINAASQGINAAQLSREAEQFINNGAKRKLPSEVPTAHLINHNLLGINRSSPELINEARLNLAGGLSRVGTESQIGVEKINEEQLLNRATGQKAKMVDGLGLDKGIKPARDFADQQHIDDEIEFSKRGEVGIGDKSEVKLGDKGPRPNPFESVKAFAARDFNNPLADAHHQTPLESNEILPSNPAEARRAAALLVQDLSQDVDVKPRIMVKEFSNFGEMLTSKAEIRDGFLRTEQYANWSQRFGEVLGQRLSLAINNGSWNVKLNLHPSSLGHIDISLDIGEKGIEGQINSNDSVARQLLQDSLPKLRATLAELYDQQESINLSLGDKEKSGSDSEKPDNSLEVAIDLLAEEFALEDGQGASINGLDVFV